MAYKCRLVEGSEPPIDLYSADPGFGILDRGVILGRPEPKAIWGGHLGQTLVRVEDGKRVVPLRMDLKASDTDDLIDRVNALERRLRNAARYGIEGAGDPVYLEFQLDGATFDVQIPVLWGVLDTRALMDRFTRDESRIREIPVTLHCKNYWEATTEYRLQNQVGNPGWWRGTTAPGDNWTTVGSPGMVYWDTDYYVFMGRSVGFTFGASATDQGCRSDNITVTAQTTYYVEARARPGAGCDTVTLQVYDVSNSAVITSQSFPMTANQWNERGFSFSTPSGCVLARVELLRLAGDASVGGTCSFDAVYLEQRSDAPLGWMSGSDLANHLDGDAGDVNVVYVGEIPGEVPADTEIQITDRTGQNWTRHWLARRSRFDPYDFVWMLLAADATVGTDTSLVADTDTPGGQRAVCDYATTLTWATRLTWTLDANLLSYSGRFMLGLWCHHIGKSWDHDIRLRIKQDDIELGWDWSGLAPYDPTGVPTGTMWQVMARWPVLAFPIAGVGMQYKDTFDTGDELTIEVRSQTTATPDDLQIGGLFLIPLDDEFVMASTLGYATTTDVYWREWDRNRGLYGRSPLVLNRYYPPAGFAGEIPRLEPGKDNWLYFAHGRGGGMSDISIDIDDTWRVTIWYRPRGIFMRGSDPS